MFEIPMEIKDDVTKIVDYLLNHDNNENLSWTKYYKKVLKELGIKESDQLLSNTVREITKRGYDIIPEPFNLEKYK